MVKMSNWTQCLVLSMTMVYAAGAQGQSVLRLSERRDFELPGTLLIAAGPGIVAEGQVVAVSANSVSRRDQALDLHLWAWREGAENAIYVHPDLRAEPRLARALFLYVFPQRTEQLLALFAMDQDVLGIAEINGKGGVRLVATAKRPFGQLELRRVVRLRDGSYVAVGRVDSAPFALRFRDSGEVLWTSLRSDVAGGFWTNVEQRSDGGLLLVGQVSDNKDFVAGKTESLLTEMDARGKILREARQEALEAILVGPAEHPMLLAQDLRSKVWAMRAWEGDLLSAPALPIRERLRSGGLLSRSAHLTDGAAAISELDAAGRCIVTIVRTDGRLLRSGPIDGIIPSPFAQLAPGAGGSVYALFAQMPRSSRDGAVEGGLVMIRAEQPK